MKTFLALLVMVWVLLGTQETQAQVYGTGFYWDGIQYQPYWPQYDPYFDLHVMHYQQYRTYPYGPLYGYVPYAPPCCFGGAILSAPSTVIIVHPRHRVITRPRVIR